MHSDLDQLRTLASGTVYTILRHVSRSGMRRCISVFCIKDGAPVLLDGFAAAAIGLRTSAKHGGIVIDGVGMDMGYALVHELGRVLGIELEHRWL